MGQTHHCKSEDNCQKWKCGNQIRDCETYDSHKSCGEKCLIRTELCDEGGEDPCKIRGLPEDRQYWKCGGSCKTYETKSNYLDCHGTCKRKFDLTTQQEKECKEDNTDNINSRENSKIDGHDIDYGEQASNYTGKDETSPIGS